MTRVRVRSLAKLNLDLRVLHKRTDGFHELRTIFQTISLADTLDIQYQRGPSRIDIQSNLNISGNVIEIAADLVLKTTGKTGRVGFVLTKRIPLGGGLGGGSTNAAAVLLTLPPLIGKPLPLEKLLELACQLGSDVPFFLLGGTAIGLDRGTELYPLPDRPAQPALIITPEIHSSTPDAYRALARKAEHPGTPSILRDFQELAWTGSAAWVNDFETVVFQQHPQLKSIKRKLLSLGAAPALMSGSGSSVFGIFADRVSRDRAVELFRKEPAKHRIYPVTMVSRSRYRALWRRQLAAFSEHTLWPPQDRYAQ